MLWKRILSALFFVPLLLAAVWFGDPWFSGILLLAAFLGAMEFYRLAKSSDCQPFIFLGTALILFFIVGAIVNAHYFSSPLITPFLVSLAVIASLLWLLLGKENAWTSWAWTLGGVFYLGWTLQHFVWLRNLEDGAIWVIFALLTTFAVDTCAFFGGRALGRHKLTPRLSPGKTWEGAIAGVAGGIAASVLLTFLPEPFDLSLDGMGLGWLILLGFFIGLLAQLGDLVESALKRRAGAEESGWFIPGHGGILDRMDSLVFTVVLVYYYVIWLS